MEVPMYFNVEKLPDAPIVIGSWFEGFKFVEHGAQYAEEANAVLDKQTAPVYYFIDMSQLQTISIEGIIEVANTGAKVLTSSHRHPMNRETILISKKNIVKLAVKGVDSAAFGHMKIKIFDTLEEALEYVKKIT